MKVAQIAEYGKPEVFEYKDVGKPSAGAGQMLVKLAAASVNPVDWKIRNGSLRMLIRLKLPTVLGYDVCGQVEDVGDGVDRFAPGDWIYAMQALKDGGAYAGYAAVNQISAAIKPEKLSPEESAAVPLAGLTALQGLRDRARLKAGQHVMVIGASGGVGHLCVQIAKALGAKVTAVCSTPNVDWVKDLGADTVIDYKQSSYLDGEARYDVVYDAVGAGSYGSSKRVLASEGTYLSTLPGPKVILTSLWLRIFSKRKAYAVMVEPRASDLVFLAQIADEGKLRPVIETTFPLSKMPAAHRHSQSGRTKGKIIIQMP